MSENWGSLPSSRQTVLVVDIDTDPGIVAMRDALEAAGFSVLEAREKHDALALAESHRVGLAVLCHDGAGEATVAVANELFARRQIHSVFVSAREARSSANALAAGEIGFLRRPVALQDFLRAIHAATARAEELAQLRLSEQRMRVALLAERDINTAIGILMERLGLSREDAFQRLRAYARSQRMRIVAVAQAVAGSIVESNRITAELMDAPPARSRSETPDAP